MIINTSVQYNSDLLKTDINLLKQAYPFIRVLTIGYSVLGKPIYCLKLGRGRKEVFYVAATHANEWITSLVLMKFIEDVCNSYVKNIALYGYNIRDILRNTSIYIVPMVNPDGVDLVNGNIDVNSDAYTTAKAISNNYPAIPFPDGWKANISGVDLNLQFPAGWYEARQIKYANGYTSPAPRDFVGYGPLTEPEALAIYNFTLARNFGLMLTYHTQGREIYWQFMDYAPPEAYTIGQQFAEASGYTLADVPYASSFAGFKDWFLQQYSLPAYTVEAGFGVNPLPISQFAEIYADNLGILVLGTVLA